MGKLDVGIGENLEETAKREVRLRWRRKLEEGSGAGLRRGRKQSPLRKDLVEFSWRGPAKMQAC